MKSRFQSQLGIASVVLISLIVCVHATNYYVSPYGSDSNSGTESSPMQTFSGALRKAVIKGDTVIAMPGLYSGSLNSNLYIMSGITITSTSGAAKTIVVGPGSWVFKEVCTVSGIQFASFTSSPALDFDLDYYSSTPSIVDSIFAHDNALALRVNDGNEIEILNSNFSQNGVAITRNDPSNKKYDFTVANCRFSENTNAISGVFGLISVSDSYFNASNCEVAGCGISVNRSSSVSISGCEFESCKSETIGAAIYIASNVKTATISNSKFTENEAKNGSAIYSYSSVEITSSIFTSNSANIAAALYLHGNTRSSIGSSIFQTSFIQNAASQSAGAIYCEYSSIFYNEVVFDSNEAPVGSSYQCGTSCVTYEVDVTSKNNSAEC